MLGFFFALRLIFDMLKVLINQRGVETLVTSGS